jgi:hypothetical protein
MPIRHLARFAALAALGALLVAVAGSWAARGAAQSATPAAGGDAATLTVIEHADHVSTIDLGEPGPSVGDMIVWGPDPLYDENDASDTGAVTHGTCIGFNAESDCVVSETILFADGSTLELQGVERGGGAPSLRTIVGGSGRYLGAIGTMTVEPTADQTRWTKVIELAPLPGRP